MQRPAGLGGPTCIAAAAAALQVIVDSGVDIDKDDEAFRPLDFVHMVADIVERFGQ